MKAAAQAEPTVAGAAAQAELAELVVPAAVHAATQVAPVVAWDVPAVFVVALAAARAELAGLVDPAAAWAEYIAAAQAEPGVSVPETAEQAADSPRNRSKTLRCRSILFHNSYKT